MNLTCADRERIFLDGTPEEWTALRGHAENCAVCAEELLAWDQLSVAASELRDHAPDTALWNRIAVSLEQRLPASTAAPSFWSRLTAFVQLPALQGAVAGVLVLALALAGGYVYNNRRRSPSDPQQTSKLLRSQALADVERTEREYMQAIDKLATEAKPQLEQETPLMASYREKLLVLDSAIADLRTEAGGNPSNAHLRRQLLAMYEEKQQTLQDVLETKR